MAEAQGEAAGDGAGPVLVVIPTYDERENLGPVVARVHAALPDARVLVVDDGSPDGTGELADAMAAQDPRISVLHRTEKAGLGAAYLAGFEVALRRGARVVVQMDADGSHPPEVLPTMIEALADADIVLGSRYVPGGEVVNWPAHREWLSRGGSLYSRIALGLPIRDMTAGYRAFRREVLAELDLGAVSSTGYCFQIDMTWRAVQAGFRVVEVPITFTERERGSSKMSGAIVAEALWRVTQWGAARVFGRGRPAPVRGSGTEERAPDPEPDGVPGARVPDTVPDGLADDLAGDPTGGAPADVAGGATGAVPRTRVPEEGVERGTGGALDGGVLDGGALDGGAAEGTVRA